jgi:hypothetical protein
MTPAIPTPNFSKQSLQWMLITASPDVARFAEEAGVHRIFVDMEVLGKAERQGHLNTHKASHTLEDVAKIREVLKKAELMVRLNPLNIKTEDEVNAAISHGAQRLMLPMFQSGRDVQFFLKLVDGCVPVTFLLETPQALVKLSTYISHLREQDHIHIGLNDLSLGLGADFLFEPIAAGLIDPAAALLNDYGVQWGFGGIARVGGGALPAEWILSEHVRLGSKWVILSRAFHGGASTVEELIQQIDLVQELENLRAYEHKWQVAGEETLKQNREQFIAQTFAIAEGKTTVCA